MQTLRNTFRCAAAAFTFFTRLPFWRITTLEKRHYERVMPFWPLTGWLTGATMTAVCYSAGRCGLTAGVAVALALTARVLLTGALHEDGFADFCDGFGGGTSRQRTLEIMKDSHTGTYGVLALALYYMLMWNLLTSLLSRGIPPLIFIAADAACKYISSFIAIFLPYARTESEAKSRTVYAEPSTAERLASMVFGLAPVTLLWMIYHEIDETTELLTLLFAPAAAAIILFRVMRRRIGGYTGDCCGATFIITETVFYLTLCIMYNE